MKPYFAKSLPKGREIKGIRELFDKNNPFHKAGFDYLDAIEERKLFLCSRDITFPCDIYCFGEKVWRKNCQSTSCPDCVKVIGEISSEATWVKEGDEFDEYQIWCKNIPFWGNHHVMIQPHAWKEPRPIDEGWSDEIIKVKGPCGHFH